MEVNNIWESYEYNIKYWSEIVIHTNITKSKGNIKSDLLGSRLRMIGSDSLCLKIIKRKLRKAGEILIKPKPIWLNVHFQKVLKCIGNVESTEILFQSTYLLMNRRKEEPFTFLEERNLNSRLVS